MTLTRTGIGGILPAGAILPHAGRTAPADWLLCSGGTASRTTYNNLFTTIVPALGTCTITIASPGVVTLNNHGLNVDDAVYLTTTGSLPTGLSANTIYYAQSVATNTFQLSSSRGGSSINTSGSQSGTHTLYFCPWGLGDGSTTFNVPDMRGKVPAGLDNIGGTAAGLLNVSKAMGLTGGEQNHILTTAELASHNHAVTDPTHAHSLVWSNTSAYASYPQGGGNAATQVGTFAASTGISIQNTGSGSGHNNMQPYILTNYIIKT